MIEILNIEQCAAVTNNSNKSYGMQSHIDVNNSYGSEKYLSQDNLRLFKL